MNTISQTYTNTDIARVVNIMLAESRWFEVTPLPFDLYELRIKPERELPAPILPYGGYVYEIELRGFDGENDDVDDLIIWVSFDGDLDALRGLLDFEGLEVDAPVIQRLPGYFMTKAEFILPGDMAWLKASIRGRLAAHREAL